jgi:hypothetical protein
VKSPHSANENYHTLYSLPGVLRLTQTRVKSIIMTDLSGETILESYRLSDLLFIHFS